MSFLIRVRSHPDALVGLLAAELATPLADPFATEIVAVPTRGIERWLTQRIASELAALGAGDGVCANVTFPPPARLVNDILRSVPGLDASATAWEGPALVGSLLSVIDQHRRESWLWVLDRYLGEAVPTGTGQRISAARKLAWLFERYARRRPEMIRRWSVGEDVGPDGAPIPGPAAWQPRLWRLVRDAIGVASLPELLPEGLEPLRRGATELGLPSRLAVYGLTAVDPLDLEVLEAVAATRDVHLYLLHASPALWNQTAAAEQDPLMAPARSRTPEATHPLLQSWARESNELQLLLLASGHEVAPSPLAAASEPKPDTLLGRLQEDVRHDRTPEPVPEIAEQVISRRDRSIQIHVCHGARRQTEVLRDAVLHLLRADPTLEPRDVVIMTPDLATFAPLLEAAFPEALDAEGAAGDSLPDLRVRIADRGPAATNPLVRFAAVVLDLAVARLDAGSIRELVVDAAVRRRFSLNEERVTGLQRLIDDINVKWGLDGAHREEWGAGAVDDQTWRRGLDRALAGVFLSDSATRVVAGVAPLEGVEGQEAEVAGLLAQIIDRISAVRLLLAAPRPRAEWADAIARAVHLLAAPGWDDQWQWAQLGRLLDSTFLPDADDPGPLVSRAEAAVLVRDWSEDRPSPLHFRTGDVTVCSLAPMRSVPYRVVCLLGMDDDRFPRLDRSDGDDLLAGHEVIGDRERSAEDRQLLLDALMAAGDHLIVSYAGRDELSNTDYPPAVPIAEMDDTLCTMVGAPGLRALTTRHPLQGFGVANFVPGKLGVDGPWSFDPMHLDGARAIRRGATLDDSTPARPATVLPTPDRVQLSDLIRLLRHPAQWHLRNHQQLTIPRPAEASDDTLQVDVDALGAWALRDRVLTGLAAGGDLDEVKAHLHASDLLPPGPLGDDDLESAVAEASQLWDLARKQGFAPSRLRLFSGMVQVAGLGLEGRVEADPELGQMTTLTASRLAARQRIIAACELSFLTAHEPEIGWRAVLVGRAASGRGRSVVTLGPMGDTAESRLSAAQSVLGSMLAIYIDAHHKAIPLPPKTGYAWQRGLAKGRTQAAAAARAEWEEDRFAPEAQDPANAMVFGDLATTAELLAGEFPDYAARLWLPILQLTGEKSA